MLHLHPCKGHQAVEAQQEWSRPLNGEVGPLSLRFDAQMGAALLKSGFQRPPMHERADDGLSRKRLIGTQQCFDRTFACWITSQHPADGQRWAAKMIPESGAAAPRKLTQALAVPGDLARVPQRLWIGQDGFQGWEPGSHHLGLAATTTLFRRGRWSMQDAVEPSRK
jgi:hypothetical protein